MDENGDRQVEYSLLHLNPSTSNFEVVADITDISHIHFAGGYGALPPSVPKCGYDEANCRLNCELPLVVQ